jgi:lactococcin 972 family bacteriocin
MRRHHCIEKQLKRTSKKEIASMNKTICLMAFLSTILGIFGGCTDMEQPDLTQETAEISSDPDATEEGGSIEIPPSETFDAAKATVVNVGGGTWNYGRIGNHCWSHYVHPVKRHSATAIRGPINRKVYANAGTWANSDIFNGSGTCYAYWNTY